MSTTRRAPRALLPMDAMRPWEILSTPPDPAAWDPRRWLRLALASLACATARASRLGAAFTGRGRLTTPGAFRQEH